MPDSKMMPPRVDDPGYWRFRAKNARELAETAKKENERAIILNIAEQYEQLARMTEARRHELDEREAHLRKLADQLLFSVEKNGERFTLTRTADVEQDVSHKRRYHCRSRRVSRNLEIARSPRWLRHQTHRSAFTTSKIHSSHWWHRRLRERFY